ncbi:MAG TPA: serine/threonine protein kinase, partial [Candidatus Eisenbacteria bacterium]|nr:serine/threonine protein kinase [Candidatus Eisenbacteria bacterium]
MTPLLGAAVGPHRLEELVASDALGVVHRAHDQASGRPLLIRLLLPLANDPEAARRFRIELAAIARLDHPSIVPVEEWGEAEGVPYVVTADPGAHRLSEALAGGRRLDPRLALRVLRGLAAALDHAHRAGVVHGAVEPSRVLLGRDGSVQLG